LPSSLKRIESGSFSHCRSLTAVTLPTELTTLASDAFWNCPSLSSLSISEENSFFSVVDGVLYNRAKTKLLLSPAALRSVTLTTGVKEIAPKAFMGSTGLESLTLSPTLETIGYGAFYGCSSLKTLWMPNAAASIEVGARTFALCESLTDGDGNGDGETNVLDLLALAGMIRQNEVTLTQIAILDADGDGRLDVNDLIEWVKAIGTGRRS